MASQTSEPSSPWRPPAPRPVARSADVMTMGGSLMFPVLQLVTRTGTARVTPPRPWIGSGGPARLSPMSAATVVETSDLEAPVSRAKVYGPRPWMVTGSRTVVAPSRDRSIRTCSDAPRWELTPGARLQRASRTAATTTGPRAAARRLGGIGTMSSLRRYAESSEAWIPGRGWAGYDATHPVRAGERHVRVA